MAVVRQEGSLTLALDVEGLLPDPDVEAAMRRAQEKNAIIVEQEVKERVRGLMAISPQNFSRPSEDRNRGDYPGSMVDYYNAEVDGLTIVLDNPTARADYFEFGTVPHEIWASGLTAQGQGAPPRGRRGQFTRGSRALRFDMAGLGTGFASHVEHPGQKATLVMYEAMGDLMDVMAENILDELEEEFARG